MMKKIQSQGTVYTFRREQILQEDVRDFLDHFDPIRLSNIRLKELAGTYKEMEALVDAMNEAALASGKGKLYDVLQRVPEKPEARKQEWKAINEARLAKQNRPGKWWQGKKKHKHGTK